MAITFLGLTIGDDGTGFKMPSYADWRGAFETTLRTLSGRANLHTEPGSLYGTMIDLVVTGVDLAGQAASEAVSRTVFNAMGGVSLEQFLADYLTRVAASQSTATIWAYGTAGASLLAGAAIRSGATSTPFVTGVGIAIPVAPAAAYAVEVEGFAAGKYTGQAFTVTVAGNAANYVANGLDTGRTVRDGLVAAIQALALSQIAWTAGISPTNATRALMVTGLANFTLSVNGPVGSITAYAAASSPSTALTFGAVQAPATSLRRVPPTAGIVGVVNILDATPGRVAETDSQFKARHMVAQRGLGGGSTDAIKAIALSPVSTGGGGATFASVEYNADDGVDIFGNVGHSVRLVIAQGDDGQTAANALWRAKAAGDNTNGTENYNVEDRSGNLQLIKIDRLTDLWIAVDIAYTIGEGWSNAGSPEVQLEEDVAAYIEALAAAADVRVNSLPIAVRPDGTPRGVGEFAVSLGVSVTQGGPYVYGPYWPTGTPLADLASVAISGRQKARCQVVDVVAHA